MTRAFRSRVVESLRAFFQLSPVQTLPEPWRFCPHLCEEEAPSCGSGVCNCGFLLVSRGSGRSLGVNETFLPTCCSESAGWVWVNSSRLTELWSVFFPPSLLLLPRVSRRAEANTIFTMDEDADTGSLPDLKDIESKVGRKVPDSLIRSLTGGKRPDEHLAGCKRHSSTNSADLKRLESKMLFLKQEMVSNLQQKPSARVQVLSEFRCYCVIKCDCSLGFFVFVFVFARHIYAPCVKPQSTRSGALFRQSPPIVRLIAASKRGMKPLAPPACRDLRDLLLVIEMRPRGTLLIFPRVNPLIAATRRALLTPLRHFPGLEKSLGVPARVG